MTAAILALLAALVPFGIWLYKRNVAKEDDPAEQRADRLSEIARQIASDDERAANETLQEELDRLRAGVRADLDRRLHTSDAVPGDQRGPGGPADEGRR